MSRMLRVFGFAMLGLAMIVTTGATQDKEKKEEKKKDTLPKFFSMLDLTPDQVKKIGDVQSEYKEKFAEPKKQIAELNKKVAELNKTQLAEFFKLLTEDQKKKYDELVANSKKKEPEKKKDDKK